MNCLLWLARPWESGRGSRSAKRQKKAPCLPSRRRRSRAGRISHRFSTEPNPKVRITINRTASMLMYGPPLASSFSAQKPPSATGLDAEFSDRTTGIDGQPTGTARPFPLWRLRSGLCLPPIDPIFGSGIPPGPNSWPPNSPAAYSVPPSVSPIHNCLAV